MSVAWFVVLEEDIEGFDPDCTLTALCRAMEEVQEVTAEHGLPDITDFAKLDDVDDEEDADPLYADEDDDDEWADGDEDEDDDRGFRSFDEEDEDFEEDDEELVDEDEVEEGPWFDPGDALPTVNTLLDHYRERRNALMVEELELLRRILEKARVNGVRFNLQMDY